MDGVGGIFFIFFDNHIWKYEKDPYIYTVLEKQLNIKSTMEKLIALLEKETVEVRIEYLQRVAAWAVQEHKTLVARTAWSDEDWCVFLGLVPRSALDYLQRPYLTFPSGFYNTRDARKYDRLRNEAIRANRLSSREYVVKAVERSKTNLISQLQKLALRLQDKGLDLDNISLTSTYVDVNLETTISDSVNTVKAWTIIASGPIQRPHYRYLIK